MAAAFFWITNFLWGREKFFRLNKKERRGSVGTMQVLGNLISVVVCKSATTTFESSRLITAGFVVLKRGTVTWVSCINNCSPSTGLVKLSWGWKLQHRVWFEDAEEDDCLLRWINNGSLISFVWSILVSCPIYERTKFFYVTQFLGVDFPWKMVISVFLNVLKIWLHFSMIVGFLTEIPESNRLTDFFK